MEHFGTCVDVAGENWPTDRDVLALQRWKEERGNQLMDSDNQRLLADAVAACTDAGGALVVEEVPNLPVKCKGLPDSVKVETSDNMPSALQRLGCLVWDASKAGGLAPETGGTVLDFISSHSPEAVSGLFQNYARGLRALAIFNKAKGAYVAAREAPTDTLAADPDYVLGKELYATALAYEETIKKFGAIPGGSLDPFLDNTRVGINEFVKDIKDACVQQVVQDLQAEVAGMALPTNIPYG